MNGRVLDMGQPYAGLLRKRLPLMIRGSALMLTAAAIK